MTLETFPLDLAEYVDTPEAQAFLLEDALESGDPTYITHALGIIARARGMTDTAQKAGVKRETLYKALSVKGDPKLSTLLGVFKALGLKLTLEVIPDQQP